MKSQNKRPTRKVADRRRFPPEERKEQILKAARDVFVRLGLNGARTKDIANEMGVTEPTLFIYFKTKQELFQAAIVEPLKALLSLPRMKGIDFASASTESEKNEVCLAAVREIVVAMEDVYPLLITAQFSSQELGAEIYNKEIYPVLQEIGEAVSTGFSLTDKNLAEFVALSTFGLSFSAVMHHHYKGTTLDVDLVSENISNLLLSGIEREI